MMWWMSIWIGNKCMFNYLLINYFIFVNLYQKKYFNLFNNFFFFDKKLLQKSEQKIEEEKKHHFFCFGRVEILLMKAWWVSDWCQVQLMELNFLIFLHRQDTIQKRCRSSQPLLLIITGTFILFQMCQFWKNHKM